MTLHSVLIEIVLSGARGIERTHMLARYGWGVLPAIEVLVQLGLVIRSCTDLRYFATLDRGLYPRLRVDA
jgi:hypothetical protein